MYCNTINWQINHKNNINQWTYMTSTISTIISCRVSANSLAVCHYSSIHEGICQSKRAHTHTYATNHNDNNKKTLNSHTEIVSLSMYEHLMNFFSLVILHGIGNLTVRIVLWLYVLCVLFFFSFNVIIFIYVAVFLYKVSLTQRERERDRSKCEFVFVLAFN